MSEAGNPASDSRRACLHHFENAATGQAGALIFFATAQAVVFLSG
jgi:hypothetical protein